MSQFICRCGNNGFYTVKGCFVVIVDGSGVVKETVSKDLSTLSGRYTCTECGAGYEALLTDKLITKVIAMNDSIQLALVGTDEAKLLERCQVKIDELARAHYERSKWDYQSYEHYRNVCYWHVHDVLTEEL